MFKPAVRKTGYGRATTVALALSGMWTINAGMALADMDGALSPPPAPMLRGMKYYRSLEEMALSSGYYVGLGGGILMRQNNRKLDRWIRDPSHFGYRSVKKNHPKTGEIFFGVLLPDQLRMELAFNVIHQNRWIASDATAVNAQLFKLSHQQAMVHGYYDLLRLGPVTPFLGVGIGYAWHRTYSAWVGGSETSWLKHGSGLAYAGTLGLAFALNDHWVLDAAYRFEHLKNIRYFPDMQNGKTLGASATAAYQQWLMRLRYVW
jgi:opacity protein-like surface antigen